MRNLKKKRLIITVVIAMMAAGLTGCSKETEAENSSGIASIEGEDLNASGEDAKENGGAADGDGQNANGQSADVNRDATNTDANTDGQNADGANAGASDVGLYGEDGKELPAPLDGAAADKLHYINEDKDLYGDICEIGDMQFTVTEIYMETGDDGGEVMTSIAPDAQAETPKITIAYDENTKFVKQVIRDGGASHEEREGSAADLKKGFTAEMNGSYEGDVFHATDILIVEVIL